MVFVNSVPTRALSYPLFVIYIDNSNHPVACLVSWICNVPPAPNLFYIRVTIIARVLEVPILFRQPIALHNIPHFLSTSFLLLLSTLNRHSSI